VILVEGVDLDRVFGVDAVDVDERGNVRLIELAPRFERRIELFRALHAGQRTPLRIDGEDLLKEIGARTGGDDGAGADGHLTPGLVVGVGVQSDAMGAVSLALVGHIKNVGAVRGQARGNVRHERGR